MKRISIIVAVAANWAIGKDNDLLWHISEDMRWFKRHTQGHPVVMGKKTWESLPIRPLPKRTNIVITDNPADCFEEAIHRMDEHQENFIIGGGSVYTQFLPLVQKIYLTRVHQDFEGDVFFPALLDKDWIETFNEDYMDSPLPFSFKILERR